MIKFNSNTNNFYKLTKTFIIIYFFFIKTNFNIKEIAIHKIINKF